MTTLTRELTSEETEAIYRKFREYIHGLSFGYVTTNEELLAAGADLIMLKEFYSPQDCLYVLDMPPDDFFTVQWFAEKEGMTQDQAEEILHDLAVRGCIYRELREDGHMWYHNAPAAHGIYEFHAGDTMNPKWLGEGLFPTLATGTLQIVYDAGVPFYRCVPAGKEVVKKGELLPEDDIFEKLKTHRRFCVSPCACIDATRDNLGMHNCDHPKGVCTQTDSMADYYIDDLQLGKEISAEEAAHVLECSIKDNLAIQTTFAKGNEIICSCNLCHCGILPALKNWPGDANDYVSNYEIEFNSDACVKDGQCVSRCTMQSIELNEKGYPEITGACTGCGQCVISCNEHARILVRKADERMYPLPETIWDTYPIMEQNRRAKGAL